MNKSKFLKKSLAMLLAILMVVAMIPLSAAADDAPTDPEPTAPSVAAPDVTVNNRNATKPQQAGDPYTVTVLDATSVSMSWVSVKDENGDPYSARIVTKRNVEIGVPFNMLDLLQEAEVIEENEENNSVTYQVTFQMLDKDKEVVGEWPLNITVVNTIPNDDTTIKAVVANQTFRDGLTDFAFLGIEGAIDNANEIITITLPIGMSPKDAGFGDGNGRNFGQAVTMVDDNNLDISTVAGQNIAQRVAPGGANGQDKYARRVFVPTSTYTTVEYEGPTTDDGAGKLVVTARDGRTRNYTVNFVQEEVFNNVGVKFGSNTYYASDTIVNKAAATNAKGVEVEYIIPVPEKYLNSYTPAGGGTAWYNCSLVFDTKGNVVRVEDPATSDTADVYSTNGVSSHYTGASWDGDVNVPLLSGKSKFVIATDFTQSGSSYQKTFTVKTEANMAPNKTANVNVDYWKNVRITLRPQTGGDSGKPFLQEFQLNGYDSVWGPSFGADPYSELPTEFDYWVDYDFEFSTGNGQHPARISAYINEGGAISIPAQDKDLVANSYWAVEKTSAVAGDDTLRSGVYGAGGSVSSVASNLTSRLIKPNRFFVSPGSAAQNHYIDNVNTEGGTFVLRVWAGEDYKDYTIHLKKPSQNTGTAVSGVKLLRQVDGEWKTLQATKSADGRVWTFEASGDFKDLLAGTGATASEFYKSGFVVGGTAGGETGDSIANAINHVSAGTGPLTLNTWADDPTAINVEAAFANGSDTGWSTTVLDTIIAAQLDGKTASADVNANTKSALTLRMAGATSLEINATIDGNKKVVLGKADFSNENEFKHDDKGTENEADDEYVLTFRAVDPAGKTWNVATLTFKLASVTAGRRGEWLDTPSIEWFYGNSWEHNGTSGPYVGELELKTKISAGDDLKAYDSNALPFVTTANTIAGKAQEVAENPLTLTFKTTAAGSEAVAALASIETDLLDKDEEWKNVKPGFNNVTFTFEKNSQHALFLYAETEDEDGNALKKLIGVVDALPMTEGMDGSGASGTVAIYQPKADGSADTDKMIGQLTSTSTDAWNTIRWTDAAGKPISFTLGKGTYISKGFQDTAVWYYEKVTGAAGGDTGVVPGVADDCFIVVDTPAGAVVTPGGSYNGRTTPIVGVSTWGVGTGFGSTPFNTSYTPMTASTIGSVYFDSNNLYEELEEGVTTLWDWWNVQVRKGGSDVYKYLVNLQKNGKADNNIETDGMIFSVKNGRNGTAQPYVIRFKEPGIAKDPAGAEIKSEGATTAIDESLVYAANTVLNAVTVVNSNIVSNLRRAFYTGAFIADNTTITDAMAYSGSNLGYVDAGTFTPGSESNNFFNPGYIEGYDSAYIGAVGGHNEFLSENGEVTVSKVPNTKNEYVIAVHVPADFMSSNTLLTRDNNSGDTISYLAPGTIFFTNLTVSSGAEVWRNAGSYMVNATTPSVSAPSNLATDRNWLVPQIPFVAGGATGASAKGWLEGNRNSTGNLSNFVLDSTDPTQQADSASAADAGKRFVMSDSDLDAWKGGVFNSDKVSQGNILYVYKSGNSKVGKPNASTDNNTAAFKSAKDAADAVYYVSVIVDKDETGELLTSVSSTSDVVYASVNQAMKTVTLNVPASYNWIGTRDSDKYDFELNFKTSDGAILLDAVADDAFPFRDNNDSTVTQNDYRNFSLTDLVQEEQDINKWVSADADPENATQFFVKDNELFVFNPNTGATRQVTGMGDEIKDAYINPSWRLIEDQEAELRVYPESRENVNTYKLELKILPESSIATLTHVQVDETTAEIDNDNRTAKVALPEGTDHKQVHISVGVNGLSTVVSVAGEPYDANENRTYDLTNPIEIVIAAENGTEFKYILTAGEVPTPTPTAGPTDEPTPTPTPTANPDLPSDLDQVTPTLREDVIKALTNGLMQGGPDGLFYPLNSMKRYEFALVVARATLREEGETGSASDLDKILIERYGDKTCVFSDVTDDNWGGVKTNAAVAAINLVVEKGYMQGTSATTFAPIGTITREQAALTMARVAGLDMTDTDVSNFADASKISSWAKGGVAAAYKAGIMNGTGNDNFTPLRVLQRQEGAAILSRYYVDGNGKPEPTDPDEGEEGGEPTNPDEGEEGGEPTNPDEGEEGGEPTNPDEGEEGGEPTNPDEGEEGGEPNPEPDDNGDDTAE